MSKFISIKRDFMTILGLVMLGICMLGLGILSASTVKEIQLIHDGEAEAKRWAKSLIDDPAHAKKAFTNQKISVKRSGSISRVFAFDMFDKNGNLFHSNGLSDWYPLEQISDLLKSPATLLHRDNKHLTAHLHGDGSGKPAADYASVAIPFYSAGDYIGSIIAFVDQTEQARYLTESFQIIAGITGLLLLIAVGIPSVLVIFRTREHVKAEERIRYLSGHDELTGLPNRASFNTHLEACLNTDEHLAVVIIDIDRFKEINNALGHNAGDSVLRYVTAVVNSNIRENDFAARIGSDQFALTLSSFQRREQGAALAAALSDALSAPLCINGEQISCSFSLGGAIAPLDADDAPTLMRHANLALGRAKADGGNTLKFFEQGMDTAFLHRRERENDLRRALEDGQFELAYQPQVDCATQEIRGFEALLRWNHPQDGSISPASFIPLAEQTELIVPIGEWVLRRACADAAAWSKPLKIAVNLSAVQFKRIDIVTLVKNVLDESGLSPSRLELEITESLLISTTGKVAEDLNGLRDLGVSIAMDDFGTGYSSLSYISSFPFTKIKIDKSFISSMMRDKAILGIVKCIIAMGRSLDVTIVAEGVETEEQNRILNDLGCQQAQGFLYSIPMSAKACSLRIARPLKPAAKKLTKRNQARSAA